LSDGAIKMISRMDEQPTSLFESLFRIRNFYKERRRGLTMIDPDLDSRNGEGRKYRTPKKRKLVNSLKRERDVC
jgi:hypothetical protein